VNKAITGIAAGLALLVTLTTGCSSGEDDGTTSSREATAATATQPPVAAEEALSEGHPPLEKALSADEEAFKDAHARFTHFKVGNSNVKSIFEEGDIVWVGTSSGVIRYDTTTDNYRLYNVRNGLLANGIFYVGRIGGRLTVGTYGGGLALLNEEDDSFEIFNVPEGLADAFIYDVQEMPNGDVWIATWSGANFIPGGDLWAADKWQTFTVENTDGGLPNDWVYGLDVGANGEVWFATEGGLARYHQGRWDNWSHEDGQGAPYELVKGDNTFSRDPAQYSRHHAKQKEEMNLQNVDTAYNPNYIVALEIDDEGVVWVGTWGGGLGRFDGEKWHNYTVKDGLPSNHVFMLHRDRQGKLWIGTSHGMAYFTDEGFATMTKANGLFSNTIFSMASQADGTLWVGSFGGVARINPPDS